MYVTLIQYAMMNNEYTLTLVIVSDIQYHHKHYFRYTPGLYNHQTAKL